MTASGQIERHPVPSDNIEKFMGIVCVAAEVCGVESNAEVNRCVEALGDAVARYVFEKNNKISPMKKIHNERKRFIAVFKSRYEQTMELEYSKTITPIECKMINQINKVLAESGFSCDEYLAWAFDDFLVENPKFRPATIKTLCAQYFLHAFIDANREIKDTRKRQDLDKKAGIDIINRARVLLRSEIEPEDKEKVKDTLKMYSEKGIILSEFRQVIETIEKKVQAK